MGRKRKVLKGAAARSVLAKTNADQATLAAEARPNDPVVHTTPQIAAEAPNKKPKHTIQSFDPTNGTARINTNRREHAKRVRAQNPRKDRK
jgi:hypothetical protein